MISFLATATLLATTQTNPARDLHNAVSLELAKYKTIQGTAVLTRGGQTERVRFKLMKPNFFVLLGDKEASWSDGEQNYTRMDGSDVPHCNLASKDSIDAPYLRGLEGFTKNPNSKLVPRQLTSDKLDGVECRALRYEQPATQTEAGSAPKADVVIFIDQKKPLPLGWRVKSESFEMKVVYKDLVFDKQLKKSDFKID